ncbi:hypothetical protein PPL_08169 [Heterostelium album PN500]|uniref:FNIP repeat-containing protein n=1 Tax=Heterostelium pallidum (strain ATCC 26659 / Pp 5 / PN500) TaxID=670386 RepID=D3BIT4_HETP5|nr:hypothetical protein PPL_08169 [Heterostelium album PN500]EFA78708.1 hypothetical protein PPL_08169 [Heterostelium album PN500]|eukprot:XP_020430832.1 hypothetical protein PPL_08169 [Heterostelium album PN500]
MSNLFENLSHIILSRIIGNLSDIVDRICFSLVCRRFYYERHAYLNFLETVQDNIRNKLTLSSSFYFNSYRDIYDRLVEKNKHKHYSQLLILNNDQPMLDQFHKIYIVYQHCKEIIILGESFNHLRLTSNFKEKLAHSNVHTLAFSEFVDVAFDQFPSNLKVMEIESTYLPYLPSSLESLTVRHKSMDPITLDFDIFHSLSELRFRVTDQRNPIVAIKSFPPNLKTLYIHYFSANIIGDQQPASLPLSIQTIEINSTAWINLKSTMNLKDYQNLKKMVITLELGDQYLDIPETVEDLAFNCSFYFTLQKSILPTGIKRFKINNSKIHFTADVFADFSSLESIDLRETTAKTKYPIGQLPGNLQFFRPPNNHEKPLPDDFYSLPVGDLLKDLQLLSVSQVIPESVKHLTFSDQMYGQTIPVGLIQQGVETIDFSGYLDTVPEGAIPPSVKSITVVSEFLYNNPLDTLPATISNIQLISMQNFNFRRYNESFILTTDDHIIKGGILPSAFIHDILLEFQDDDFDFS